MKNTLRNFGFIALIVIFIFSMTACSGGGGGNEDLLIGKWYDSANYDEDETPAYEFTASGTLRIENTAIGNYSATNSVISISLFLFVSATAEYTISDHSSTVKKLTISPSNMLGNMLPAGTYYK